MTKISVRKLSKFLLVLTYALYAYSDAMYVARGIEGGLVVNLKYLILFILIGFCELGILNQNQNNSQRGVIFMKEVMQIGALSFAYLMLSLFTSLILNTSIIQSLQEIIKLVLPAIAVYCILNTFDFKDIYSCMRFILIFSIIGYILEIGITTFTIDNLLRINFSNSYSPFESHYAAGASIAMCTFFMYYRENKFWTILSFIFALATFKRISVAFAIILVVLPIFFDVDKVLKKELRLLLPCMFILLTVFYYWINQPQNSVLFVKLFGKDAFSFTMGRSAYFSALSGRTLLGLGTTTAILGKSIEMDLIKLMFETTIVGLAMFVFLYFSIAGSNLYCNIYMIYIFLNLLGSHSLTNSFSWILTFTIIGTIRWKQESDLSYLNYHKNRKQKSKRKCNLAIR